MKRSLTLLTLALVFLMAAPMAFAGGAQEEAASADDGKMGGTLVFARSGDSVGLDPARETDGESFYGATAVFDTLVEFVPGKTQIRPALAESWEFADDNLSVTFKLREGVKFHDGTDFTADAVVFSFERQLKEDHPYYDLGPWKYWGYMDMSNIVDEIVAVDDYTVRFDLQKPEAPFLSNLAMDFAAIVSPAAFEELGEDFKNNPVGTGPFKFVEWRKDDAIIFERNDEYWADDVYLDRLILKVIPDATARWLALQKGEVDVIDFPSVEDLEAMKADPNVNVMQQEGMNVGYLAFNTTKEPFDDVRVRKALNYAVNKDEIIEAVYGSAGTPAKNPLPPGVWSYNEDVEDYPYDPEMAKELLAEAGYADGFSAGLWAMPVARPYNPNARKIAEILQAQYAEIGVETDIVSYEWGTYLDKTDNLEHDMAMLGWTGDNGDPDNFLWVLLSAPAAEPPAGNIAGWKNQEFTALIKEAKETMDQERRTELYEEAQLVFKEEAPWLTIAHSVVSVPMKSSVEGFHIYPTGKRVFRGVWIED